MILLKKILFPTDFSRCAEQAYSYALDLAKLHNAELHILHAAVLHGYMDNRTKQSLDNLEEMHRQSEKLASGRLIRSWKIRMPNELTSSTSRDGACQRRR